MAKTKTKTIRITREGIQPLRTECRIGDEIIIENEANQEVMVWTLPGSAFCFPLVHGERRKFAIGENAVVGGYVFWTHVDSEDPEINQISGEIDVVT